MDYKEKAIGIFSIAAIVVMAVNFAAVLPLTAAETPGGNAPVISNDTSTGLANPGEDLILVIVYNYGYESDPNTFNLVTVLENLGYSVTALYRPAPGTISSTLASNDFDQVYLWDATTILGLTDSGDKAALTAWYAGHRGNIVIDGRSYGLYFDVARDKLLIENIAEAFAHAGGGLWIGVDDASWQNNGNALLTAIGYETVSGIYTSYITGGDTTSTLLTTPNPITPSELWVGSVGEAPTGVQSDGVELRPLLWNEEEVVYTSYALRSPEAAPALTPLGLIALVGLLSAIAAVAIVRKRH
jgi:hypothetical protein